MNTALIIGQRAERLRNLSACLAGLGFTTDTCADLTTLSNRTATPRVVVWDDDMANHRPDAAPATVANAPISLWIA
ncbi:MAG: hypothetical protein ACN6OP_17465, partial [Pseudomonadales bacterium]